MVPHFLKWLMLGKKLKLTHLRNEWKAHGSRMAARKTIGSMV